MQIVIRSLGVWAGTFSLIGAYEEPPAMPVGYFLVGVTELAPPPLLSLPAATGILASAFRLWSNSFLADSHSHSNTKKSPHFCELFIGRSD